MKTKKIQPMTPPPAKPKGVLYLHVIERVVEQTYSNEPYGSWSKELDVDIRGFTKKPGIVDPFNCTEFRMSPEEIEKLPPDMAWAVVATYSSGDTFGRSAGHKQVVGIFPDRERAEEAVKLLNVYYEFKKNRWEKPSEEEAARWLEFAEKNSGNLTGYIDFLGYFESLTVLETVCLPKIRG